MLDVWTDPGMIGVMIGIICYINSHLCAMAGPDLLVQLITQTVLCLFDGNCV